VAELPSHLPLYRRLDWINTSFLIITPILALVWTPFHIYLNGLEPGVIIFFLIFSVITSLSITGGYHRLFAHRSYQVRPWVKFLYLAFGAAAFQGSALKWCSAHREHHRHTDSENDPYNIQRGFLYAHMGWVFFKDDPLKPYFAADLLKDKMFVWQHKYYFLIAGFVGFGIPTLVGWSMGSPLGGLLYAGLLRTVFTQHCTFLINSACHFWGSRPYSLRVSARDNPVMAIFTYGEGYHNYHHKFQADYRNGIKWYHWDPTKWLIRFMATFSLASNLKRVSPEEILKARMLLQEETLVKKGLSAETVLTFRQRVEEAQKQWFKLKSEYKNFKSERRARYDAFLAATQEQYTNFVSIKREQYRQFLLGWREQKRALRAQTREARLQFRIALHQWNKLQLARVRI
jgi:stearoyl-CoA desaturase (Delta-9 desaturase)